MTDTRPTMADRIAALDIEIESSYRGLRSPRGAWQHDHHAYTVTLYRPVGDGTRRKQRMTVPWRQGTMLTEPPDAVTVLDCLAGEAATYDNAADLAEWAAELSFDPGDRHIRNAYLQAAKQTSQLRTFLADAYDAVLYETERE